MTVLGLHLSRLFLGRWLAALLALAFMLQLLDLLDNATDVLTRGGGALGIGHYALLRFPSAAERLVPLAALVAALLTFARLAAGSEAATLRALGVSGHRMVGLLLPACGLVAMLQFGLGDQLVPRTQRLFTDWWTSLPGPPSSNEPERVWLRAGQDVVALNRVATNGAAASGVLLVQRDREGRALARLDAERAVHGGEGWTLRDVRVTRLGGSAPERLDALPWPDGPTPRNLADLARPIDGVPVAVALQVLDGRWIGGRGEAFYRTRVQSRLAAIPGAAIMVLLAFPATRALPRRGGAARVAAVSVGLGLLYVTLAGGLAALGEAGAVPPAMAAWTAPILFCCVGLVMLLDSEG